MEHRGAKIKETILRGVQRYGKLLGVKDMDIFPWTAKKTIKWIFAKSFWAVVIAILSTLTIKMSIELCGRFVQQPTTYSLNVISNQPFAMPKSTVCLPIYAFTLSELMQIAVDNKTSVVNEYFANQTITKTQFLTNNGSSKWPDAIMDYLSTMLFVEGSTRTRYPTFRFVADYSNLTAEIPNETSSISVWFIYYAAHRKEYLSEDSWNAQILLEGYLQNLNVSFFEIKHALGQELIKLFNLGGWHYGTMNDTDVWQPISITSFHETFLTWNSACYDIDFPSEDVTISSAKEWVQIQIDPYSHLESAYSDYYPYLIFDLLGRFGLDIEFNVGVFIEGNFMTYASTTQQQTVVIGLQNEYQAMSVVRGEVKCTGNTTTDMCNEHKIGMTILKCLPLCNQRKYVMEQSTYGGAYNGDQYARIQLMVESFTYAYFTENCVWGVEDIVGALGGVLGLWLGIDIKMSIELMGSTIYLLYSIIITYRRIDDNNEDNNNEIGNANEDFRQQTIVVVPRD